MEVAYYLTRGKRIKRIKRIKADVEFVEKGTGTGRQTWPVLVEAVQCAQQKGACLIIVKLGRLKWNPSFLRLLTGVRFVCCDNPLDEFTLPMQLAQAQWRAQRISCSTKDTPRFKGFDSARRTTDKRFIEGTKRGIRNSSQARRARAASLYELLPLKQLRAQGKTYEQIAEALNQAGHRTTIGTPFNVPTVYRILHR